MRNAAIEKFNLGDTQYKIYNAPGGQYWVRAERRNMSGQRIINLLNEKQRAGGAWTRIPMSYEQALSTIERVARARKVMRVMVQDLRREPDQGGEWTGTLYFWGSKPASSGAITRYLDAQIGIGRWIRGRMEEADLLEVGSTGMEQIASGKVSALLFDYI